MGYTVELWAVPPDVVVPALRSPGEEAPAVAMPDDIRADWSPLARRVAEALGAGGGRLVSEYAHVVAATVRASGYHYGSLDHTSAGGEEFRRRFLPGPAASRYGREAIAHLIVRDLAGLSWEEYPRLGHLTATEVGEVAGAITGPADPGDHPADMDALVVLDGAITRAARFELELHAIYT